jgi:sugar fermentation stimulation protein A
MEFGELIPGEFIWRDNRFKAAVRVGGKLTHAHIANSGRLSGLLIHGSRVWLSDAGNENRVTSYDLMLVEKENTYVSIDARLPNVLVFEALRDEKLKGFDYSTIQKEVRMGKSRIDFRLSENDKSCWIETKSVTLMKNGAAMFPDAPTQRGRKHLIGLSRTVNEKTRAAVFFVVQRPDVEYFSPNHTVDPKFAESLIEAVALGVEARAYCCKVNLNEISIMKEIPIKINTISEKIHV